MLEHDALARRARPKRLSKRWVHVGMVALIAVAGFAASLHSCSKTSPPACEEVSYLPGRCQQ